MLELRSRNVISLGSVVDQRYNGRDIISKQLCERGQLSRLSDSLPSIFKFVFFVGVVSKRVDL